jgi:hypothetical protein
MLASFSKVTLGGAALAIALLAPVAASAADGVVSLRCDAEGAGDTSLNARYVQRTRGAVVRRIFSADFEAAPNGTITAGQTMEVLVGTRVAGSVTLGIAPTTGDIYGDLNLDSRGTPEAQPFPATLVVRAGSLIRIRINGTFVVGCRLQ